VCDPFWHRFGDANDLGLNEGISRAGGHGEPPVQAWAHSIANRYKYVEISKEMLGRIYGNNAYSKLQRECGDDPNKLTMKRTPLEKILIQYGSLAKTTKKLPTRDDWAHARCKPSVSGIEKHPHHLKWADMPSKFLEYAKDKPEWKDVVHKLQKSKRFDAVTQPGDSLSPKTPQGFERIIDSINKWVPKRRHRDEDGYQTEIRSYLEYECELSVREEKGETKADLLVNEKFPVELKKSPNLAEYDRLFGQLARHALAYGTAIAVICDIKRRDEFDDFISRKDRIFGRSGLKVVVISK
jgi:hypothetical protein